MHWYNPKRRVAEMVVAPYTDEEAEHMLWGATDSWAFLREYERLRDEGMGIEQAHDLRGAALQHVAPEELIRRLAQEV
jgi:hypothetical protein